ncbi:MAG: Multidrug resistance protein MdtA [Planctomycetes bacterium]|nr:Multidrug resistance protein MdtA [Planctomycetota bacterium]
MARLNRRITASALLALCLAASACGPGEQAIPAAPESAVHSVQKRDLRVTVTEKGTLKTANQVLVRPKIPGQAKIVSLVDEGSQVQAGDVVCELDSTETLKQVQDLENRVIALRGEVAAAEAELEIQTGQNASDIRDAEQEKHFAEVELERWEKGEFVQEKSRREIRVTEAKSELERATRRFEQMPDLEKEGFVTKEQVEEERLRKVKAESEVHLATLDLESYERYEAPKAKQQRESDVRKAGEDIVRTQQRSEARLAQRKSAVERQRGELRNVEARLAEAKANLENMVIRAPSAGMVVYGDARNPWDERQVKVGESVYSGQPFLTLPDLTSMLVVVAIHEADISRIKPGQTATVAVETARERTITGKVLRVAPMAAQQNQRWGDGVKRFNVDVQIDGDVSAMKLKPGLTATVEILVEELKDVVAVPVQAVFSERGKFHVYRQSGGAVSRAAVTIERGNQQYAVVTAGLAPGDGVLLFDPTTSGDGGSPGVSAPADAKEGERKAPRGGKP